MNLKELMLESYANNNNDFHLMVDDVLEYTEETIYNSFLKIFNSSLL